MSPVLTLLGSLFLLVFFSITSEGAVQWASLPIYFEANEGQTRSGADFVARGLGYEMMIAPHEATLRLRGKEQSESIRIMPVGAAAQARTFPESEQIARVNYFMGASRIENVRTYGRVRVQGVYENIDLVYYGNGRELEYDFEVAPGADPRLIRLRFEGAERLSLDPLGNLRLPLKEGELLQRRPVAYQAVEGTRRPVECDFQLDGSEVSFRLGRYDPTQPLVIDPVLVYSTYFGSSAFENVGAIAVDASDHIFITGSTRALNDFPLANEYNTNQVRGGNVFVMRLSPGGQLVYATVLGGEDEDDGFGIAVDNASNAYVTGLTRSSPRGTAAGFPYTEGAVQTDFSIGSDAVFVTKLNAGGGLVYSTFLMAEKNTGNSARGTGIAVGADGVAYVTGQKGNFAFLVKLNQTGTQMLSESYINSARGPAIKLGPDGGVYLGGDTISNPAFFPTKNAYEPPGTLSSAFFMKLAADATNILYSTAFATRNDSSVAAVGVDADGMGYIAGSIERPARPDNPLNGDFRPKNSYQPRYGGGGTDAFIAKFDPTKAGEESLVYTTYLGGTNDDRATSIAVDDTGQMFVAGVTASTNFPVANAWQTNYAGGGADAFVAQLNAGGTALVFSTYFGGTNADHGSAVAVDLAARNVYVAGQTKSGNFQTTNAFQATLRGADFDGFVAKIELIKPELTLVVNTVDDLDDGTCDAAHCSLREAINAANKTEGRQTIKFDIPATGIPSIRPVGPLPAISEPVVIDGKSQPETGWVELDGSGSGINASGLVLGGGESEVRGMVINRFTSAGIRIETKGGCVIDENILGLDAVGQTILGNADGVVIADSAKNMIGTAAFLKGNIISGNSHAGIWIKGGAARENRINSNTIGLDRLQLKALENGIGVLVEDAPANFIGSEGWGNVISGNAEEGVRIAGAAAAENRIVGNSIGVSSLGLTLGNGLHGVAITNAGKNQIGSSLQTPNVISGNSGHGISISGPTSKGNRVIGNMIGSDLLTGAAIRNGRSGVFVQRSSENQIGGTLATEANLISGNAEHGIHLEEGANRNQIQGNIIGANRAGNESLANRGHGIFLNFAGGNTIGGETETPGAGAGNLISGNIKDGVHIIGQTSLDNTIQGNLIGPDRSGTARLGNSDGVEINSNGNVIGGDESNTRNIISGNFNDGVKITGATTSANRIQGNYIGVDKTGLVPLKNGFAGVVIVDQAQANVVGGLTDQPGHPPGNVISGNSGYGIDIVGGEDSRVIGNLIGPSADGSRLSHSGTVLTGNLRGGIRVRKAHAVIGGEAEHARNIISGNDDAGIHLEESTVEIKGNFIGVTPDGRNALPNKGPGIDVLDCISLGEIGGLSSRPGLPPGNVISGNEKDGIYIRDGQGAYIRGNIIGANGDGIARVPNTGQGIHVDTGSRGVVIGGSELGSRNQISGNSGGGVSVNGGDITVIQGNVIGTDPQGSETRDDLGNGGHGVIIRSKEFLIGGEGLGEANTIAFNGGSGILLQLPPGSGFAQFFKSYQVFENSTFSNGGLGIDWSEGATGDGVTPNDRGDNDAVPNYPVLTRAMRDARGLWVQGVLEGGPGQNFLIHYYANESCDPSGHGEGQRFLGRHAVTTSIGGRAVLNQFLPAAGVPPGWFVTATAFRRDGTSEFSRCVSVLMGSDQDGDSIIDSLEDLAPEGDGNRDGVPDSEQPNVTTTPTPVSSIPITLQAPANAVLSQLTTEVNETAVATIPVQSQFPLGHLSFNLRLPMSAGSIRMAAAPQPTVVTLFLPPNSGVNTFICYGPRPGNATAQWYEFTFDGSTGAVFEGNQVRLHLVDGGRGDTDLSANGTIVLAGALAFKGTIPIRITEATAFGFNYFFLRGSAEAGRSYRILTSPDLRNWQPSTTNHTATGFFEHLDPLSFDAAARFYRLEAVPKP